MPVRLNRYASTTELSEQDRIDLDKLYADYPVAFDPAAFDAAMKTAHTELWAGRFNDRLIGAMLVDQTDATGSSRPSITLTYLCVRAVTRDRRVASDLLRESLNVLRQQRPGVSLTLSSCLADNQALDAVLSPQGFTLSEQTFSLTL